MEVPKLKSGDRQALRRAAHQQAQFIGRRLYEATVVILEQKADACGTQAALQPDVLEAAVEQALQHVAETL